MKGLAAVVLLTSSVALAGDPSSEVAELYRLRKDPVVAAWLERHPEVREPLESLDTQVTDAAVAARRARALHARLAGPSNFRRAWGNLAAQSGDSALGRFGQAQMQQADYSDPGPELLREAEENEAFLRANFPALLSGYRDVKAIAESEAARRRVRKGGSK